MLDVNVLIGWLILNLLVASVYFAFIFLFNLCFINCDFSFLRWFVVLTFVSRVAVNWVMAQLHMDLLL